MINILIVDDQKAIADSLASKLDLKSAGIDAAYTAYSAMEAKLVMMNFDIDILLTDIEMPEEDGLSLFKWTKEKYPNIVGVFLTSHADFSYAQEAIRLGGFDYILQPALYENIEATLKRAVKEAQNKRYMSQIKTASKVIEDQRDSMMELFNMKASEGNDAEADIIYKKMKSMFFSSYKEVGFHALWIQIIRFDCRCNNKWNENLLKLVFRNVLEELFEDYGLKVMIAKEDFQNYMIYAVGERDTIPVENWIKGVEDFAAFINGRLDFKIAIYPKRHELYEHSGQLHQELLARREKNTTKDIGVLWENTLCESAIGDNVERIRKAEDYIRANIANGITRTQVADYVHLNEDYFTREFKKYTGYTYKDYEVMIRMETAKNTLGKTNLPVSIVASRVGYDNFSHFSKAFKKYTGLTPQEFRKENSHKS